MTTLSNARFEVASASVTGGAHRQRAQGGQDGICVCNAAGALVAVVTDGCGSSPNSQIGAVFGANLWARALAREVELEDGDLDVASVVRARSRVIESLAAVASDMVGNRNDVVRDHFLFTTVAAVVAKTRTVVFAVGDGVVGINGRFVSLDPGADNAPAYVGYELCAETKGLGDFSLISVRPTIEVQTLVLATDGACPLLDSSLRAQPKLGELLSEDRVFSNSDHLRRQLDGLAAPSTRVDWSNERVVRDSGVLRDDTTIVALRRRVVAAALGVAS